MFILQIAWFTLGYVRKSAPKPKSKKPSKKNRGQRFKLPRHVLLVDLVGVLI